MTQELNKVMGMVCERERQYYNAKKVDAVLAEKEAAIAELKNEINRKEGVGQRWFERCMEARTENVRLKRALWIERAERAHVITLLWNVYCYQNNCLYFRDFMNVKCNPFRNLPKKTAMEWSNLWESIETKCRAKAEKYK